MFNRRGDGGQATGGLAVDDSLGWKGPESCVATVPHLFGPWADPQERHDIFMNNPSEQTRPMVTISAPITLTDCERFGDLCDQLAKDGVHLPLPTGNQAICAPIPVEAQVKARFNSLGRFGLLCKEGPALQVF